MKSIFLSTLLTFLIINPLIAQDNWQEVKCADDFYQQSSQLTHNSSNRNILLLTALQVGLGMMSLPIGPVVFGINALPALYYYCTQNNTQPKKQSDYSNPRSEPERGNDVFAYRGPSEDELLLVKLEKQVHQDLEIYEYDTDNVCYRFARERLHAIEHGTQIITKEYVVEQIIIKDLPHKNRYRSLCGMDIQHVIHQEIIESLTTLAGYSNPFLYIKAPHQIDPGQIQTLSLCARNTLDEACVHNRTGRIDKAMQMVDVGANVVQLVATIYEYAVLPIAQGTIDAVQDTAHMFLHPIDTAVQMVTGITRVSVALARIIIRCDEIALYELTGDREQVVKIQARLQQELDPFIEWANRAVTLPPPEMIRQATRLTWSFILPNKGARALCGLFGAAQVQAQRAAQAMRMWNSPLPVPAWCTNVELNIANRTSTLLKNVMGNGRKAFQSALQEISSLPPIQMLEHECARLSTLFDKKLPGFDQIKHLFIEFDYEHLFIPKLTANGKRISGFHHDMNGILESLGIIKLRNLVQKSNGFYEADLWFDGVWHNGKTFFPKDWTREKVMQKIFEAYKAASKKATIKLQGNRFEVVGFIEEDIKIRIIVDEFGKSITQYPVFEEK